MGDSLQVITAFSRESSEKVYVQHRLSEHAKLIGSHLKHGATFYVCGDAAHMARAVNLALIQIITEQYVLSTEKAIEVVKKMRSNGSYQEDVWS